MSAVFVVPFRDRGRDWRRPANLAASRKYLESLELGPVHVVDDGREGDRQFNRSAAYNRGTVLAPAATVIVFYETDLLVPREQIVSGIRLARSPGLVVPFSRFLALEEEDSQLVRMGRLAPEDAQAVQIRGDRKSIGAVNICSRETLARVGQWDETFEGAWYDDDSMEIAFRITCGPTRFVDGPGFHLHHLPGAGGDFAHLSAEDKAATGRNKARWKLYRAATTPERIRELTAGGL